MKYSKIQVVLLPPVTHLLPAYIIAVQGIIAR